MSLITKQEELEAVLGVETVSDRHQRWMEIMYLARMEMWKGVACSEVPGQERECMVSPYILDRICLSKLDRDRKRLQVEST